jgi:molybdopterin/thiamine biosynthesis adenylyltransferase
MIWYIENYRRHRREREAIELLVGSVDWLVPLGWRIDGELRLIWDADITTSVRTFPISVRYPNHFPHSPPVVLPRGDAERWSGHQYGPGQELCLEYGPDNWHPDLTGADMVASAHRLVQGERPAPDQEGEVASRHQTTLGQELRGCRTRFVVTRALAEVLASMAEGTLLTANALGLFHYDSYVNLIASITLADGQVWRDALPEPLMLGYQREIALCRWPAGVGWPPTRNLRDFRAAAALHKLILPEVQHVMIVRGTRIRVYFLNAEDDTVFAVSVIPPQPPASRLDEDHAALAARKVAIVGCGSLGSKIAAGLARAGVGRFLLVDDDLLLPDNFVRHDLHWRDVGTHKADSVAARIQLVNPTAECETRKHRLGGQESSGSIETLIEALANCDLLVDATAEPTVFNYLCAAVAVGKKPLVWAEVFGGGFGGLIARYRPGIEPSPALIRSNIEAWCAERCKPLERPANRYEGGPQTPAIADDADVTVIAAHATRMAIDLLIPREPSSFPNSVYLIGLAKGEFFGQPFETYPIEVGPPEPPSPEGDPDPEEAAAEMARVLQLFSEYKNAAAAPEPVDSAS